MKHNSIAFSEAEIGGYTCILQSQDPAIGQCRSFCGPQHERSEEKELAYFDNPERDTLARLARNSRNPNELNKSGRVLGGRAGYREIPMAGWGNGAGIKAGAAAKAGDNDRTFHPCETESVIG